MASCWLAAKLPLNGSSPAIFQWTSSCKHFTSSWLVACLLLTWTCPPPDLQWSTVTSSWPVDGPLTCNRAPLDVHFTSSWLVDCLLLPWTNLTSSWSVVNHILNFRNLLLTISWPTNLQWTSSWHALYLLLACSLPPLHLNWTSFWCALNHIVNYSNLLLTCSWTPYELQLISSWTTDDHGMICSGPPCQLQLGEEVPTVIFVLSHPLWLVNYSWPPQDLHLTTS